MSSDFYDGHPALQPQTFDFGHAIRVLKAGERVRRVGWHGKGMHVELWPRVLPPHSSNADLGAPVLALRLPDGRWRPGWNASTEDVLAEDWQVVP